MAQLDPDDRDVDSLLGTLESADVTPSPAFRDELVEQLGRRLALRRGEGGLPGDWALCPFDRFCIAEQRLPRVLAANCPCLRGWAILRVLKAHGLPLHARPCAGQRMRTVAVVSASARD